MLTKKQVYDLEEVLAGRSVERIAEGLGVSTRQVYRLLVSAQGDEKFEVYFTLRDAARRELRKVKRLRLSLTRLSLQFMSRSSTLSCLRKRISNHSIWISR